MQKIQIWEKAFPLYDPQIKNEANDNINTIDFYPVETDKPLPLVIVFPGGGYTFRSKPEEAGETAQYFNSQNMHAAVVHYRVAPYHYPTGLMDAQRAIKLLRYHAEKLYIDPDRVFTLGYSAGGHLCGMTATFPDVCKVYGDDVDQLSHRPNGSILCYPVLSADDDKMHRSSFLNLLGDLFPQRQDFSLEKRVSADTCPCFIMHSAGDTMVLPTNSLVFAESLIKHNIPCNLHIFQYGAHGAALKENDPCGKAWPALATDWIKTFEK